MSVPAGSPAAVRVLLVDDEPLALDNLRIALERHPEVRVVGEATDGPEAVRLARSLDPDLLLLDVQMPGMDGFEVLRDLSESSDLPLPEVVFVTAFDEHALRAFEVHALDYLLKPFDDARFAACVERAVERVRGTRAGGLREAVEALLRQMPGSAAATVGFASRIAVRERDRIRFVAVDDVDWLQAAGNYVRIHAGGGQHLIRATMAEMQRQLDPRRFVRIHRSSIVNVARIKEVQPWVGGDYLAILRDGRKLKVSRTYREDLLRPLA